MDSDTIYPNNGEYFMPTIPQAQQEAKEDEIKRTLRQVPLLNEVLSHLDDRITATDSVKQSLVLASKYQISKDNALIICDIVRQQLESERSFISTRIKRIK